MDHLGKSNVITGVPIREEKRLESVVDMKTEEKSWCDTRKKSKVKERM